VNKDLKKMNDLTESLETEFGCAVNVKQAVLSRKLEIIKYEDNVH
jgi:hypothetical protein